jgi:hypothetical protein
VGPAIPRWFLNALPVVHGPKTLVSAYAALGAHLQPTDDHWKQFFVAFSDRHGDKVLSRRSEEWRSLVTAYRSRGSRGVPEGTSGAARFLLSRDGTLHSLADLREDSYLEDDFPELSEAARRDGADLAFAELTEGTRDFLLTLGLRRLSVICNPGPPQVIGDRQPPLWFRDEHRIRLIERLRHPLFAKALLALGRVETRRGIHIRLPLESGIKSRLDRIETIAFAQDIRRTYQVGEAEVTISAEESVVENRFVVVSATSLYDLNNLLAYGLAELLGAVRVEEKRALALAILPLLQCRNTDEMTTLLRRQGIAWSVTPRENEASSIGESAADPAEVMEGVVRQIAIGLEVGATGAAPATAPVTESGDEIVPDSEPLQPLPPIDDVDLIVVALDSSWTPRSPDGSSGGRTWTWNPPTAGRVERDREVGKRGEEVVYRQEVERLRAAGHPSPEDVVVWASLIDAGADHDIRSLAEDGKPLWIEVKATTGRDGLFEWPKNEFQKALREGDHYELWRVYEASSESPIAKRFRDPVNLFREGKLRLDLATLRAVIQPMGVVEADPVSAPLAEPPSDVATPNPMFTI